MLRLAFHPAVPDTLSSDIQARDERPGQFANSEHETMSNLPKCPLCSSSYTYEDRSLFVCPECGHEWKEDVAELPEAGLIVKDSNGNALGDGDTVTVIKDLKVKGTSLVVKVGTKVRNIRLVEGDHNIDCKIEGIGPMKLKSEFVKKA